MTYDDIHVRGRSHCRLRARREAQGAGRASIVALEFEAPPDAPTSAWGRVLSGTQRYDIHIWDAGAGTGTERDREATLIASVRTYRC